LYRRLDGLQGRPGPCGEEKNLLTLSEIEPRLAKIYFSFLIAPKSRVFLEQVIIA
jgi:hypothetical protein